MVGSVRTQRPHSAGNNRDPTVQDGDELGTSEPHADYE